MALLTECRDPGGIETCCYPDLVLPLSEGQRPIEQRDDILCDRDALCGGRSIRVCANGVGDDRDPHCIGVSLGRADVVARGLDPTANPSEQIDFVGDV